MPDLDSLESLPIEELLAELRRRHGAQRASSPTAPTSAADGRLSELDAGTIVSAVQRRQRVIYGVDNRLDVFQLAPGQHREDADTVVAIVRANFLTDNGNGTATFSTQTFGPSQNLCPGEPFFNQPSVGPGIKCSGVLVYTDVIATAGHCIYRDTDLPYLRFVFGFRMRDANTAETVIAQTDIYCGVRIIGRQLSDDGQDWCLVRLDRHVSNHRFAGIRRSGRIADLQSLHVIGHPLGLPMKFADGAAVRDNEPESFFVANLDVYAGNSGAPVFNSATHEVEGVVSRGETDFVMQGSCRVSLVCPDTGCAGEWCTRITTLSALVPPFLLNRSAEFGTAPAAAAPTACVIPGLGVHNIAYCDTSGRLHELWRDAAGVTGTTDLTATANGPKAFGQPFAYVDTSRNAVILLFRGPNRTIRSLYWSTGAVGHDNLSGTAGSPPAERDPVGYYAPGSDTHHVIYRTSNNHLHELWWIGVDRVQYGGDLTTLASAPPATGQPSAFVNDAGDNIVAYRSSNGHIRALYWTTGDVGHDDLSGFAGTPPAAGDPFGYYTAHDNTHQIVYLGDDGHLWELYWRGNAPVAGWNLTSRSGAPGAAGIPAAFYNPATHKKYVIYRSADHRLHAFRWTPGGGIPEYIDFTTFAGAPPAHDGPTAFLVNGPDAHHFAYRGPDNQIYELIW